MSATLITIPEAAHRLGIHVRIAQLEVQKTGTLGGVPVVVINGRNRVSAARIDAIGNGSAA